MHSRRALLYMPGDDRRKIDEHWRQSGVQSSRDQRRASVRRDQHLPLAETPRAPHPRWRPGRDGSWPSPYPDRTRQDTAIRSGSDIAVRVWGTARFR